MQNDCQAGVDVTAGSRSSPCSRDRVTVKSWWRNRTRASPRRAPESDWDWDAESDAPSGHSGNACSASIGKAVQVLALRRLTAARAVAIAAGALFRGAEMAHDVAPSRGQGDEIRRALIAAAGEHVRAALDEPGHEAEIPASGRPVQQRPAVLVDRFDAGRRRRAGASAPRYHLC